MYKYITIILKIIYFIYHKYIVNNIYLCNIIFNKKIYLFQKSYFSELRAVYKFSNL